MKEVLQRCSRPSRVFLALAALTCAPDPAAAQAGLQWLPGDGVPGTNEQVYASTLWDPDGAGPQPVVVVIGGWFTLAGDVPVNYIATYDPVSEQFGTLGTGMNGPVYSLTVTGSGRLVAGGEFSQAGGAAVAYVAEWNGATWVPLGSGCNDAVYSLASMLNGDVVAGGQFTAAGGAPANRIARWNGTTWAPLGAGMSGWDVKVRATAVLPNGDLVAGGFFDQAGGVVVNHVARWNGTNWSALGSGMNAVTNTSVSSLTALPTGEVIAGGSFTTAGGTPANKIASWSGSAWTPLGSGMGLGGYGLVASVLRMSNGTLVASGLFTTAGGVAANYVARWNGSAWAPLGSGLFGFAYAMKELPNGDLFVGGALTAAGGNPARYIARWDGANWRRIHRGFNGTVRCIAALPNGRLAVGGDFTSAGTMAATRIAIWNGTAWTPPGSGVNLRVEALAALPNNDLLVGGHFSTAGGLNIPNLALLRGTLWRTMGWQYGPVSAIAVLPNGDIAAGGLYGLRRWNGASWVSTGLGVWVKALCLMPNGDLIAGGDLDIPGFPNVGGVARWNGMSWSPIGTGLPNTVSSLAVMPNGDLVAGGVGLFATPSPSSVARWNGTSWVSVGSLDERVNGVAALPNGDLLAATGIFYDNGVMRWDGNAWSRAAGGTNRVAHTVLALPDGDVVAGGDFGIAGANVSAHFARMRSNSPATAIPYGVGCASSAGPLVLTATQLPWIGSTFRARTTGLPANSVALGIQGVSQTAVPLPSILPQGVAGCALLATPNVLEVLVPVSGVAHSAFDVPNAAILVGQAVYHQVAPIEFGGAGNVVAVTSSNGLRLTIGLL